MNVFLHKCYCMLLDGLVIYIMSKNLHINDAFAGFGNAPNKIKENMNATGRMR